MIFTTADEFDRWLGANGTLLTEVWLEIPKKGSGAPGISADAAGDVAICHGWIDGQRRSLDADHFRQRYSPRRAGSAWSQVNVDRVARLEAAGRLRAGGIAQIEAAKADGRWAAAYTSQRLAEVPPDLAAALGQHRAAWDALSRTEQYTEHLLPLLKARTPATRARLIERTVARVASRP